MYSVKYLIVALAFLDISAALHSVDEPVSLPTGLEELMVLHANLDVSKVADSLRSKLAIAKHPKHDYSDLKALYDSLDDPGKVELWNYLHANNWQMYMLYISATDPSQKEAIGEFYNTMMKNMSAVFPDYLYPPCKQEAMAFAQAHRNTQKTAYAFAAAHPSGPRPPHEKFNRNSPTVPTVPTVPTLPDCPNQNSCLWLWIVIAVLLLVIIALVIFLVTRESRRRE